MQSNRYDSRIMKQIPLISHLVFLICALAAVTPGSVLGSAIRDLEGMTGQTIDRPGSGSGESDWEREKRRREWAEWRAEQKAAREAQRREESVKVNEAGNKAYRAGDWKTAVKQYKKAKSLNPNDQVIRQNLKNAEAALMRKEQTDAAAKAKLKQEAEKAELELKRKQQYERDLNAALKRLKGEQGELANQPAVWIEREGKIVERRLQESNKWSRALAASLTTKAPPLPYKKLSELQSGDVLLIAPAKTDLIGKTINAADSAISGTKTSDASHTVLFLKQVNGIRFFLDNIPGEGPRIVPEAYILNKYGKRSMDVAKLAQPLRVDEGEKLYQAAREMRAKNVDRIKENKWFDATNYGAWGKNNVVCAEADWSLLRTAGRAIPESNDRLKKGLGIDFSPADFHGDMRYFLVSPLSLSE
jgi:hypothetical protein